MPRQTNVIGRLLKYLFFLAVLGFAALAAYTYAAPLFGVDFAPPQSEMRQPVTLYAK